MPQAPSSSAPASIMELATGYVVSQTLYAVTVAGVPDALVDGAMTAATLAERLGLDAGVLARMLAALATRGVFERGEDGAYRLSAQGQQLRSDAENSLRPMVVFTNELLYPAWSEAPYSLRTGEPCFARSFGADFFDWLGQNPDGAATFHAAMSSNPANQAAIVDALPIGDARIVADIGGGNGSLLSALLARHASLSAILYDRPEAIAAARAEQAGPLPRCELITGDFFTSAPAGADLYLLQRIIHDWADAPSLTILRNVRAAMGEQARLIIIDRVIDADDPSAQIGDLTMLMTSGGAERTLPQFSSLLEQAGLSLVACHPTRTRWSLIEARAA